MKVKTSSWLTVQWLSRWCSLWYVASKEWDAMEDFLNYILYHQHQLGEWG
jgi:hypothetical protein